MRAKRFTYTLSALDEDGFASAVTGAINVTPWATILGSPGDDCAHQTTVLSTTDLSGINYTFKGTDANGREQTEVIAGPSSTTINLVNYFKTMTSISANATMGTSTMTVGWTTLCSTPIIPCAVGPHDGPIISISPSGITLTMQETATPIFATSASSTLWQTLISSGTAVAKAQADIGITGIRALISVNSSGILTMDVAQARA
jgi:hypothetical protein